MLPKLYTYFKANNNINDSKTEDGVFKSFFWSKEMNKIDFNLALTVKLHP